MWLKLDLYGFKVFFRVKDYHTVTRENYYDNWCYVETNIELYENIKTGHSGSLLLSGEIEYIQSTMEDLLEGKIEEIETITFLEPVLRFVLNPSKTNENFDPCVNDVTSDLQLCFWNGYPTDNYLSLRLYRKHMEYLISYIKLIRRQLKKQDPEIAELIKKEIIVDYHP